jgi:adenine deaminase
LTATGSHLAPTVDELLRLRAVATGAAPGDLAIRNGTVVTLHTGELLVRDVIVSGRHIAAVTPPGRLAALREIDATGLFVGPTFIDAHIHIEYTMLTPGELARLIVPKGTVTLLADPNCIANVLGTQGMDYVATTATPLRILQQVSSQVPRTPALELGGAVVADEEIARRVQTPEAVTLGESNPFGFDEPNATKHAAAIAAGKRLTGHTARLSDEPLWGYLATGIGDDHNALTTDEVLDRLRLGAMLTVMSGSMNDNSPDVFADLDALGDGLMHIAFCADDKHVEDLETQGHIDHHVRQAVKHGVDPVLAWRMATLAPAIHYRIDHLVGSVTPSRLADLQLVRSLEDPRPELVMVGGQVVAEHGVPLFTNDDEVPDWTRGTIHLSPALAASSFAVAAEGPTAWVQAMEMYDGYFKRAFHAELTVADGAVQCDLERDVLKVVIVDRHHGTDAIGVGFVKGFGLRSGALAATTNCENQNLVMIGTSDSELLAAAQAIRGRRRRVRGGPGRSPPRRLPPPRGRHHERPALGDRPRPVDRGERSG